MGCVGVGIVLQKIVGRSAGRWSELQEVSMKNNRKLLLGAVVAVVLAICAFGMAACGEKNVTPKEKHTLTFIVGTVPYDTVTAEEGSAYTMKEDPTRQNYDFDGWSLTQNGAVVELPATMPSEDRTYYAVFSARYNLTLNAGIGTLSDDRNVISTKKGQDLYTLLSGVTPTVSDGDATFAGWYLRGNELISETSGLKMPGSNVEAVAKYSVGYTIEVFKETDYDTGEYETKTETVSKTAFVGDKITEFPSYTGYYYDTEKENDIFTSDLGKNSADNAFALYYKLRGYDVVFNANLPAEVEFSGNTESDVCGYGKAQIMPECGFEADGYRFQGWSTEPDGDVDYCVGEGATIERATTFYAQWVRGLTELSDRSSDRIYVMDSYVTDEDGKHAVKVVYLERFGLEDILGEYNPTTHVFTFKNANAAHPDEVLLRGVANLEQGTFTYLNTSDAVQYTLLKIDGTVDSSVTITLADDGKATYNDGTGALNGSYAASDDGSMIFIAGETQFAFRPVPTYDGNTVANFMIRGEEYGEWNNISQAGIVDGAFTLHLDGYGSATMQVIGLSNSLTQYVVNEFDGIYDYGTYDGEEGLEIRVVLFNSSYAVKQIACLLMVGEYHGLSEEDTEVYTNVYLERFETTLYGKPADGEQLDTATADKIELSGYSVLDDSATYTYTDEQGQTVTVKGKYEYDRIVGTLCITPSEGKEYLFEITVSDDENRTPLFEPVEEVFGQYMVRNLDSAFGPSGMYIMLVYNNGVAAFAFRIPVSDNFYGNIVYEYTRMIMGEYTVAVPGAEGDQKDNEYQYDALVSPYYASYVYNLYGSLVGIPLDISGFGSFRFKFVYSAATGEISYVNVTVRGDFQTGNTLTYEGVEYTLDGFGNAYGQDGEGKEIKLTYSYDSMMGIGRLFLVPDASKPDEKVLYMDARRNGNFVQYDYIYGVSNAGTDFVIIFFKDGTAALSLADSSYGSLTFYTFSYGNITKPNELQVFYEYERDDSIQFSDVYFGLATTYDHFKFTIITVAEEQPDGTKKDVTYLYLYEADYDKIGEDGEFVITDADGNTLTIYRNDGMAYYMQKGKDGAEDITYSGKYKYYDGKFQMQIPVNAEATSYTLKTFELEYDGDGNIVSFHTVNREVGYYVSVDDRKSYFCLTGIGSGEAGKWNAEYREYNAETGEYKLIEGTYSLNSEGKGYDFTYETGEVDDDGKAVTETMIFYIGTDTTGIPVFKKYVMELNTYVYYMTASYGQPVQIGMLQGGGYSDQVFTLIQTQYTGNMEWRDDYNVWVFTATNGSTFYFKVISGMGVFLLDNTYVGEAKGTFELSEEITVEVAATEETEEQEAVPAHTAVAKTIEMSGMAFAYLHYDYLNEDGKTEDKVIMGIYYQYATNGFMFIQMGVEDEDDALIFRFRLMMHEDDETGEVAYVAELADMDYFGTYEGEDLTVVNLNGFSYAYYVDSYGRVFGGSFVTDENDPDVITITYIADYTVQSVTVRLDKENHTYVTVAPADDDDEGENA